MRPAAEGWIMANCRARRRLMYPFFGACSTSSPNSLTIPMILSWIGRKPALRPV
jgi:hypothetical protein